MAAHSPAPSRRPAPAARTADPRYGGGGGRPSGPGGGGGGAGRPGPQPPARRRRRWLPTWRVVVGGLLLVVLMVVGAGAFAYATTPVPALNADALSATTTVYFSDRTTVMGKLNNGIDRKPLSDEQMPQTAKDAAVASEDRTFYQNKGVSVSGLGRAVYGVLTGNPDLGGGSTITQQYVKNITGNDQRAYTRKATEAIQALKVDQRYSKDQILTGYLNTVYFGRGAYGIGAASKAYFDLDDPSQLSAPQAALLIGILPAPSAWDPVNDPINSQKRYAYVMGAMQQLGTVGADVVAANPQMPGVVEQKKPQWFSGPNGYILDAIVKEVVTLGKTQNFTVATLDGGTKTIATADDVETSGLDIVSTVDPVKQDAAVKTMQDPDVYPTKNRPATVRAGLISIDPATGGVVAMYAGSDPETEYDAVTLGSAQAGSTFKPFTLLAALESGDVQLSDTFNGSSPQTIDKYKVFNYGSGNGEQFGNINLVKATADSVNTVYVRLNSEIGPQATADVAARLGVPIDSEQSVLSNVLGTATVRPIQMAQAYAALANGGTRRDAHFIASITQEGADRYTEDTRAKETFDSDAVANTVYAMQAVTKSGGTAASVGKAFGKRPIAGKTGTTNDNKAAWFNGFTPQLETAVVLYNSDTENDGAQLSLGSWGGVKEITGGTIPAKIWTAYMKEALDGTDVEQFAKPSESVTSDPSPTPSATPSATPTDTPSPTDSPSASGGPSDSPTDGTGSPTDGATDGATDDAQAAGLPQGLVQRIAGRAGQARAGNNGNGNGGASAPAAGPGGGQG